MIFTKASTRTRVSFEAGMAQLGGSALFLSGQDTQLGRGEPIEDSARVISSMVDIVMIRTFAHADVEDFAAHSSVPVINGLNGRLPPLPNTGGSADLLRSRGDISGARSAGWGRQQRLSLLDECGPTTRLRAGGGVPRGYDPDPALLTACGRMRVSTEILLPREGAHLLVTDVWASMGQESEQAAREASGTLPTQSIAARSRVFRRAVYALPASPSGRGNHGRAHGRTRFGHLAGSGKSSACAKSADGITARRLMSPPECWAVGITIFSATIIKIFHARHSRG